MRRRAMIHVMALGAIAATVTLLASACSSTPSSEDRIILTGPSTADFTASIGGVDAVFERRCGSLDCHGAVGRAMRIYGITGGRLENDAGLSPGAGSTTAAEIAANYHSVVSLEPERMEDVVKNHADPYSLLILKKPLGLEAHKGGPAIAKGDSSETCILSWLQGQTNKTECTNGAAAP
jgi:hypothetical protein